MLVNLVKTLSPHVARTLNSYRGMSKPKDQNMIDGVFEIPVDASTTEDSGSPIRNNATSKKIAHVESRSPHDVPDVRAMLSGRVCFLKRPGRTSVAERGIALLQFQTVSNDTHNMWRRMNQQRSNSNGLHWEPGPDLFDTPRLVCQNKNWLVLYNHMPHAYDVRTLQLHNCDKLSSTQ